VLFIKKKFLASTLALFMAFSSFAFTPVSAKGFSKNNQHSKIVSISKTVSPNKQKITLKVGGSHTLKVAVPTGTTVAWTSSDSNVATVTDGKIVAVSIGSCTITAALSTGKSVTYTVTVKSATTENTLRLTKQNANLTVGGSCAISAVVPSGTTNQTVTWASSDANIATLSAGKIVAVSAGSCTITATLSDGQSAVCTVTVISATDVFKIQLRQSKVNLAVGKSCTVKAIVTPSTATDKAVTWTSSDTAIATVTGGKITAVSAGTCTITASTSNGKSAICTVTVISATDVNKVQLRKTKVSLKVGKSCTVKAIVTPSTATDKAVTWTSSNTAIATVTDGKITAVSAGTCTITASTSNGKSAVCTVTVKAAS
jgi:uncharacterized protein YjdB